MIISRCSTTTIPQMIVSMAAELCWSSSKLISSFHFPVSNNYTVDSPSNGNGNDLHEAIGSNSHKANISYKEPQSFFINNTAQDWPRDESKYLSDPGHTWVPHQPHWNPWPSRGPQAMDDKPCSHYNKNALECFRRTDGGPWGSLTSNRLFSTSR